MVITDITFFRKLIRRHLIEAVTAVVLGVICRISSQTISNDIFLNVVYLDCTLISKQHEICYHCTVHVSSQGY